MDVQHAGFARRVLGGERGDLAHDPEAFGPLRVVAGRDDLERRDHVALAAQDRRRDRVHVDLVTVARRHDVHRVLAVTSNSASTGELLEQAPADRRARRAVATGSIVTDERVAVRSACPARSRAALGVSTTVVWPTSEGGVARRAACGRGPRPRRPRASRRGDGSCRPAGRRPAAPRRPALVTSAARARLRTMPVPAARLDLDDPRAGEAKAALPFSAVGLARPSRRARPRAGHRRTRPGAAPGRGETSATRCPPSGRTGSRRARRRSRLGPWPGRRP